MQKPRVWVGDQFMFHRVGQFGTRTKLPGPPLAKAEPDPTNKPAPILPPKPLRELRTREERFGKLTNGYHLHVSALEFTF
jgi:hypothetical protein